MDTKDILVTTCKKCGLTSLALEESFEENVVLIYCHGCNAPIMREEFKPLNTDE